MTKDTGFRKTFHYLPLPRPKDVLQIKPSTLQVIELVPKLYTGCLEFRCNNKYTFYLNFSSPYMKKLRINVKRTQEKQICKRNDVLKIHIRTNYSINFQRGFFSLILKQVLDNSLYEMCTEIKVNVHSFGVYKGKLRATL